MSPQKLGSISKINKLHHLNENKQPIHMRYHLFLHYGWFLQNLGKDHIRTNMHTTVCTQIFDNNHNL